LNTKEYISSGIIESYILGLASPEEAGIFECVIKNNAEVNAAFIEAQQLLEDFATAQAVEPPAELKDKIWEKIKNEEVVTLYAPDKELNIDSEVQEYNPIKTITPFKKWKSIAVAASVLFLVSIASNLFWITSQNKSTTEIDRLQTEVNVQTLALQKADQKWNMIANPDMQTVALNGVEKHPNVKAVVFWDKKTKQVYLHAGNLPDAPAGMQYQLWAIADGKPISAGLYTQEKDSEIPLAVIANAKNFAITLEKAGGSEQPTMENMYVIGGV